MGSQGFGYVAEHWVEMLSVAFILFGLVNALNNMSDQDFNLIFQQNNVSIQEQGFNLLIFTTTFGAVTPSYLYNLPLIDGHIVGINDIPYFDLTDLIILVPIMYIIIWLLRKMQIHQNPIYDFLYKAIIILIIFFIVFLATKAIQYNLYLSSGQKLGFTEQALIDTRNSVLTATEEFNGIFGVLAILGGIGATKKITKKLN